jgi:glycosyltransferase involved in cell wall biosynthesis
MRILAIHNFYQQAGGEDESVKQQIRVLESRGHDVYWFSRHNNEIPNFSLPRKFSLLLVPTWSIRSYRDISEALTRISPDVAHFHNFFPLISPSAHHACARKGIAVVQTLHNYRLLCSNGLLYRQHEICEECISNDLWRGIYHGCYRRSRLQTAPVALMLALHRLLRTWNRAVDVFIAPSEFSRHKLCVGGISESKIQVSPDFLLEDPGPSNDRREYAVFVGRLGQEKGLCTLLQSWEGLPRVPLKIIGDGPLRSWIEEYITRKRMSQIEVLGNVAHSIVIEHLKKAFFLIMPSSIYETFGRVIIEAYAAGTPVIASRIGAIRELVREERTGLLFEPGSITDLSAKVRNALENPAKLRIWGLEARLEYEEKYNAEKYYQRLMEIYHLAMVAAQRHK